jgi:hypothetical protein
MRERLHPDRVDGPAGGEMGEVAPPCNDDSEPSRGKVHWGHGIRTAPTPHNSLALGPIDGHPDGRFEADPRR